MVYYNYTENIHSTLDVNTNLKLSQNITKQVSTKYVEKNTGEYSPEKGPFLYLQDIS